MRYNQGRELRVVGSHIFGCNAGFFGYDILEHFSGGLFSALMITWLALRNQKINILHNDALKNFIIILAVIALLGIGWEILEFSHDHIFSQSALFQTMTIFHPKNIVQPSNSDTMGDLVFDLLGATTAAIVLKLSKAGVL